MILLKSSKNPQKIFANLGRLAVASWNVLLAKFKRFKIDSSSRTSIRSSLAHLDKFDNYEK